MQVLRGTRQQRPRCADDLDLANENLARTTNDETQGDRIHDGKTIMNDQKLNTATVKKWEAIACDNSNHALIAYRRLGGGSAIDVFEILGVRTDRKGTLCLFALSLGAKHHAAGYYVSTSILPNAIERNRVVAIPLITIIQSRRYEHGTELNEFNNYKYHETVARAQRELAKTTVSCPVTKLDSTPVRAGIENNRSRDLRDAGLGSMIWLLYAIALLTLVLCQLFD